jgi:cell division septal protein FtsQ
MSRKNKRFDSKSKRTQRTWLFLLLGGIVLVGLAFLFISRRPASQPLAAIEVQGAPSLKVNQEQVDLGNVELGRTVQVSFRLTNVGDQPLRFSELPYIEVVDGC